MGIVNKSQTALFQEYINVVSSWADKLFFVEGTLNKRRGKMGVVRRRQLKRSSLSEAMTKSRQIFGRKNSVTPISCRPG